MKSVNKDLCVICLDVGRLRIIIDEWEWPVCEDYNCHHSVSRVMYASKRRVTAQGDRLPLGGRL
jgi:hypothetical protein